MFSSNFEKSADREAEPVYHYAADQGIAFQQNSVAPESRSGNSRRYAGRTGANYKHITRYNIIGHMAAW